MTRERREAILTAALPALVAGALYVFAIGRGVQQEARAAQAQAAEARRAATAGDLAAGAAVATVGEVERLTDERARLEAILATARTPEGSRAATSAWLLETLAANDVRLLEETDGGAGASAPSWLRAPQTPGGAGLRTLSLEGRYLDVLAALEAVAGAASAGAGARGRDGAGEAGARGGAVIPVALSMAPGAGGARPRWRLVLWM